MSVQAAGDPTLEMESVTPRPEAVELSAPAVTVAVANTADQHAVDATVAAPENKVADSKVEIEISRRQESSFAMPKAAWRDVPNLTIEFTDLEYHVPIPAKDNKIPSLPSALLETLMFFRKKDTKVCRALERCSGVIKPGSMTLILAPPGHGKSTLLRVRA